MKTTFITGLAIWLWSTSVSAQSSAVLVGTVQEPGLNVTNIETAAGNIKVYLPQNIKAGDRISGTVSAVPNGNNEKELAKNQAYLQGCVVALEDQTATTSKLGILGFIAPTVGTALFALLRDDKGKTLARFPIPIQKPQIPLDPSTGFEIPTLGQSGTALPIPGPTDGDLSNSVVQIGNNFYQPIAESPDGMVIRPADDAVVGVQPIKIQEGSASATARIRIASVKVTAGRLNLLRNEATSLVVRVSGLEFLKESITLKVRNETPGSVRLANGNEREIKISKDMVKPDGTFEYIDVIHSFGLGSFMISAVIMINSEVECGETHEIFTNEADSVATIITIDVFDNCKDHNSSLRLEVNGTSTKNATAWDGRKSVANFEVLPGGKIYLTCSGDEGTGCPYTLHIRDKK